MQLENFISSKFKKVIYNKKKLINGSNSCFIIYLGNNKIVCDTFIRIYRDSQILLINTDIHLNNEFCPLPNDIFYSQKCFSKSLLSQSIRTVNKLCKGTYVQEINLYRTGDLLIRFANDVIIEIMIDISMENFIYYQIYNGKKLIMEQAW